MKALKNGFRSFGVLACLFVTGYAFAGDEVISPSDFLNQVLQAIHDMGGLSMILKVAAVITLLVSSMKVSFLKSLIWDKLGAAQAWVAPVLGLAAGILMLAKNGSISVPGILAYVSAGAGAVILHELLDTIKAIPGLGAVWVSIINVIENVLGGGEKQLKI